MYKYLVNHLIFSLVENDIVGLLLCEKFFSWMSKSLFVATASKKFRNSLTKHKFDIFAWTVTFQ